MEVFIIRFTPNNEHPGSHLKVTFSAHWGGKSGNSVFELDLSHEHLRELLYLGQVYADPQLRTLALERSATQAALLELAAICSPGERENATPAAIHAERFLDYFGKALFEGLFSIGSAARDLWIEFYDSAGQNPEHEYRLVLEFSDNRNHTATIRLLMALPWELIHEPQYDQSISQDRALPLLLEQQRVMTLVRCYQPARYLRSNRSPEITRQRPSVLLIEAQEERQLMARLRPSVLDQRSQRLWCNMAAAQWPLNADDIADSQPDIIHIAAHGSSTDGRNWLALGSTVRSNDDLVAIGPYKLARELEQAQASITLLASFVCLSGVEDHRLPTNDRHILPEATTQSSHNSYSLLDSLCPLIPSLLLMQGLLDVEDAAVGSKAFYDALAQSSGVARATRIFRQRIYSQAEQPDHHRETGWWLATLYLADPASDVQLVSPPTPDLDLHRTTLTLPTQLSSLLNTSVESPRLVVLQCPAKQGKTVRMRRIADLLRDSRQYLLDASMYDAGSPETWLDALRHDLAQLLQALRPPSANPAFTRAEYHATVRSTSPAKIPTVFVLIDDGNRLTPDQWRSLLPSGICADLVFVTTTNEWQPVDGIGVNPELIELEVLTYDELRNLQAPNTQRYWEYRPERVSLETFHLLHSRLEHALVPLSVEALAGIAGIDRGVVEVFLDHAAQYQIAFRIPDGRYESVRTDAETLRPSSHHDFLESVQTYIARLYNQRYSVPADLLEVIAHRTHYRQIQPLPYPPVDGPILVRWSRLANLFLRHPDGAARFARIAAFRASQERFPIVRDALHYLVLQRARHVPPALGNGWLWRALLPMYNELFTDLFDDLAGQTRDVASDLLTREALLLKSTFVTKIEEIDIFNRLLQNPDLTQHSELLATLRESNDNQVLLQNVYDLHSEALAEHLVQQYEDETYVSDIRRQTSNALRVVDDLLIGDPDLDRIISDPVQVQAWLKRLEQELRNSILSITRE
jgi:hypothetical protein